MPRPPHFPTRTAAVVFDFDETIIDLEPQHTFASSALAREMGSDYEQMPESWRHGSGRRVIDDVREMRAHFGWTRDVDELFELRQRFFAHSYETSDLVLMPGVERVIRALHAKGLPLAIASSSVLAAIEAILRRLGLRELFVHIVDGSAVVNGKPDPEPYLLTFGRLGVEGRDVVVFEDSNVGVVSANRAGAYVVAVRNPHAKEHQDLSAANVIVGSMEDVDPDWLASEPKAR